jgi:transaldolase
MNRIAQLHEHGQSLWLDFLDRAALRSGQIREMVQRDEITGMTSNPTLFAQAFAGSAYDDAIQQTLDVEPNLPTERLYEKLAIADIREAADLLRPVYDRTNGVDGYVSFELSPRLAHDTEGSIEAARRLFSEISRPNAYIKIPATDAGIPAIRQCLTEGININVTLMFSLHDYDRVAAAYLEGLEHRQKAGKSLVRVSSVASFFVSRIDTAVDNRLPMESPLRGRAAIANAKLAYQHFLAAFRSPRFAALGKAGATVQRPLWASTGVKDPAYRDVMYVEELIGPDTVCTAPLETIDAFRHHGVADATVTRDIPRAGADLAALVKEGVDFDAITRDLKEDGVRKFAASFDSLLETLEKKRQQIAA